MRVLAPGTREHHAASHARGRWFETSRAHRQRPHREILRVSGIQTERTVSQVVTLRHGKIIHWPRISANGGSSGGRESGNAASGFRGRAMWLLRLSEVAGSVRLPRMRGTAGGSGPSGADVPDQVD
jgi:choline dehydrogenase-like flavoprotein